MHLDTTLMRFRHQTNEKAGKEIQNEDLHTRTDINSTHVVGFVVKRFV